MLVTLFTGTEVKGARRWIDFAGMSLQPSEFMKPAFVVIVAWLFAENRTRTDIPGNVFATILLVIAVALLVAEPDFGQTMLIVISWGALFFLAGMSWIWIAGLGVLSVGGAVAAYATFPHVAARIDRFVSPQSGDTFQVDRALDSILRGGWLGQGPGEGVVKRVLPDAHTDFIFAVAAEEFGIIVCMALVLVFALIVFRGLSRSAHAARDPFVRLASAGLVVLFGVQSVINMAVNLNLMPAKGMTLPFISYGGSSMIAIAFGMGLLLAFTRAPSGGAPPDRHASRARVRRRAARAGLTRGSRSVRGPVLLAAGGTGGHLFPAEALALALAGARLARSISPPTSASPPTATNFPPRRSTRHRLGDHHAAAARSRRRGRCRLAGGLVQARILMARLKPAVAVGFGGYPTVPPMLAAAFARVPTIIHEQNAVFGRANRFLAPRVTRIATSVAIAERGGRACRQDRRDRQPGPARGPRRRGDALSGARRRRSASSARLRRQPGRALPLRCRARGRRAARQGRAGPPRHRPAVPAGGSSRRVRQAYDLLGVEAELAPFFADLPKRIAEAHLVVCRSGASTCTELAVIGRPAILVPLPHALDQDQKANAAVLADAGGGWLIEQAELTPARLAGEIAPLIADPPRLAAAAAAAATTVGRPDAVDRLADLVEEVAAAKPDAPAPAKSGTHEAAQRGHRAGSFHRHRRHRHERHRRGARQPRSSRPGLRRQRQRQRPAPARPRHRRSRSATTPPISATPRSSSCPPPSAATIPSSSPPAPACCRSCAAPRCWPS